ncbi:MAG: YadA-like family protein, partial [Advenella sp.]|nr:YadA-like family protein [Advenella sp.]
KFKGDDGKEVERKLNETLGLAGGADIAKLSKDNIGVVAELDDDDKPTGNMSIQLAKDLTGLNSATFTKGTNTTVINHSGLRIKDGPSVTVTGIDAGSKKITHVAPGVISKTSTDAVNGSQLWSLADSVQEIFGGNVSFDFNVDTGKFEFTSPTYTINDKPYDNVQDAIDKLAEGWKVTVNDPGTGTGTGTGTGGTPGTGTGGPADIKAGDQLTLVAGDNIDITQGTKKPGVGNEPANVDITISVDPNLVVNSVTAGNSKLDTTGLVVKNPETENSTVVNGDGLSFVTKDGDQIGPSVSVIKGINAGNKKITHVAKGTAGTDAVNVDQLKGVVTALGGGSKVNEDGTIKAPTYTVGKDKDGEGKNVFNNVGAAVSELNKGWTLQTNGLNDQQIQSGDIVNFANNDGNIVITQVVNSAGVVDVQFDLGETINVETVNATTVNATTVNASTFKAGNTIVNNNGVSFVNNEGDQVGPSVSVDGINAGGKTITNVAPGVNETDAVNVGQLQGAVTNINNQINSVRGDLRRVDKDARAGTASAAAMANLPQAYLPGKSVFAIATAGHRGEQGYAAGLSTISDNGKWILKGSVSGNSRGDATYGAGVGYQW